MTKRYYYTCPLKAAFMVKYHDIAFDDGDSLRSICEAVGIDASDLFNGGAFYIHPDSVVILEPKVNDAIQIGDDLLFWVCADDTFWEDHKDDPHLKYNFIGIKSAASHVEDGARIIQRDGIPFMMPESEEV